MYYMSLLASSSVIWTMISLLGRGIVGNALFPSANPREIKLICWFSRVNPYEPCVYPLRLELGSCNLSIVFLGH